MSEEASDDIDGRFAIARRLDSRFRMQDFAAA